MTESHEPAAPAEEQRHMRAIKSFVMRAGRMTEGQQRGLEQGLPKFGLELADGLRDFDQVFGRSAPRTFEIGFGMGHSTLLMAAAAPEQDFIGVEVHRPGVGALLNGALAQNLSNIRVYTCDALEVLRDCVADASLDRVLLYFPDPWHKSRHHKRRFVQRDNLDVLARLLKPGAELRLATDDPSYLPWMIEHACTHAAFEWLAERPADWRGRPADWPPTRYEQKMLAGHQPAFLRFRRR